jgi:hypothetical protein
MIDEEELNMARSKIQELKSGQIKFIFLLAPVIFFCFSSFVIFIIDALTIEPLITVIPMFIIQSTIFTSFFLYLRLSKISNE